MTIRHALRDATAALHQQVDDSLGALALENDAGLALFLERMARGLASVEHGLERADAASHYPEWPERRRLPLVLAEIDRAEESLGHDPIELTNEAEIWGALYVLEGARLGSRLLARRAPGSAFLTASARDAHWPEFLQKLEAAHARLGSFDEFVSGTEKAFRAFL